MADSGVTALAIPLQEKYNIQTNYFWIDVWPFSDPILYIFDPDLAKQCTVDYSLPKYSGLKTFINGRYSWWPLCE